MGSLPSGKIYTFPVGHSVGEILPAKIRVLCLVLSPPHRQVLVQNIVADSDNLLIRRVSTLPSVLVPVSG